MPGAGQGVSYLSMLAGLEEESSTVRIKFGFCVDEDAGKSQSCRSGHCCSLSGAQWHLAGCFSSQILCVLIGEAAL